MNKGDKYFFLSNKVTNTYDDQVRGRKLKKSFRVKKSSMLVQKYDTVNQKFSDMNKFIVGLTCLIIQVKYMNHQIIDIKY